MAVVRYKQTSPYFDTPYYENYLDVMTNRPIPKESDDQLVELNQAYQYRPDLLALDLYQDAGLWWVFAQRNMDKISDPVYDLIPGLEIFIPQGPALRDTLGV